MSDATPQAKAAAFPTSVNDQITDSITQVNTKVLGDAPAIAMGNLFIATSQALANAAHNATQQQQQSYITMQASTTEGITTLYSIDTASDAVGTSQIYAKTEPQSPEQVKAKLDEALNNLDTQAAAMRTIDMPNVKVAADGVHTSDEFAEAMRTIAHAFATSLHVIGEVANGQCLHMIKLAATTVCLGAMIKSPEQTAAYEHILAIIKDL